MRNAYKAWMVAALAGGAVACAPTTDPMDTTLDPSMSPDSAMMVDTMMTMPMPMDTPRVEQH